jgi:hypothetical protein
MVDKIQNQSIEFIGQVESKNQETPIMDFETQATLVQVTKNYNKMINDMFLTCAELCLKNFKYAKMSEKEALCAENCQRKYFESHALGRGFMGLVLEETAKTDIFSDKDEVDIVKNVNKAKLI